MRGSDSIVCVILVVSAVVTGCDSAVLWKGRVEPEGGTAVVENVDQPQWDELGSDAVRFELEQVYGTDAGPDESIFGNIRGVAVDRNSNVYVYDWQTNRLVSFDRGGEIRWAIGRHGQGPGEFDDVRGIACDDQGSVFVANHGGTRLDQIDVTGKFVSSQSFTELKLTRGFLAGFLDSNSFVVSRALRSGIGVSFDVVELKPTARKVASASLDVGSELRFPDTASFRLQVRVAGGRILVGNQVEYTIREYSDTATLTKVIKWNTERIVRPGFPRVNGRDVITGFSVLDAPVILPSGHLLVHVTWPRNVDDPDVATQKLFSDEGFEIEWSSSIDIFDTNGRLLASLARDGGRTHPIGRLAAAHPDGSLYTVVNDPFPQVRRYSVVFSAAAQDKSFE